MINFPDSPSIGQAFVSGGQSWTWDGVKWTPSGAIVMPPLATGDNRIINGDMRIDQRNNGASGTGNSNYTIDRWKYVANQTNKGAWQRGGPAASSSSIAQAGFFNTLQFTSSSAYTPLTGDFFQFVQAIEADMVSDFAWGTSGAKPVTLSFWANSNIGGTFGGVVGAGDASRSYPFTYSLVANTWTFITITIPGDTGGTWVMNGNASGVAVHFDLGAGATLRGPANVWASANYVGANGAVNTVATNGATFAFTGVKLEIGSIATPFNRQSLAKSLADCQRYYQSTGGTYGTFFCGNVTSAIAYIYVARYPVSMRGNPTVALTHMSAAGFPAAAGPVSSVTTQSFAESRTANATVNAGYYGSSYTADAEL